MTDGIMRVVVTGAECTGKTVVAKALAAHFSEPMVDDAARVLSERKRETGETRWSENDILRIAGWQAHWEDVAMADARRLIVCDGDILGIATWYEDPIGVHVAVVEELAQRRLGDIYLLMMPDVPYVSDGVRGGPDHRDRMHTAFAAAVRATGRPVVEVSGAGDARTAMAIDAVEAYIGRIE